MFGLKPKETFYIVENAFTTKKKTVWLGNKKMSIVFFLFAVYTKWLLVFARRVLKTTINEWKSFAYTFRHLVLKQVPSEFKILYFCWLTNWIKKLLQHLISLFLYPLILFLSDLFSTQNSHNFICLKHKKATNII